MSTPIFRSFYGKQIGADEWLRAWTAEYRQYDEREYQALIAKNGAFISLDYERIGRWKDNASSDGKWKPNVAMVAYEIWMQAASQLPKCPAEEHVAEFLRNWSERNYRNKYRSGVAQEKRFGLSRATTLLHFLSGGHFPIFDSRVRRAVSRLFDWPARNTVLWYLDSYRPIFSQIAAACGTTDLRHVDKALFCYGARNPFLIIDQPSVEACLLSK